MKISLSIIIMLFNSVAAAKVCVEKNQNNLYKTTCREAVAQKFFQDCKAGPQGLYNLDHDRSKDPEFNKLYDDYQTLLKIGGGIDPYRLHINHPELIKLKELEKCRKEASPTQCFLSWRFESSKKILSKIEKTKSWKNSKKDIDKRFKEILNNYEDAMLEKWSFKLDVSEESGLNQILEKLKSGPLSEKSRKKLLHTFNSFSNNKLKIHRNSDPITVGLGEFQASYNTGITIFKKNFYSPIKKVKISNLLVNHNINPRNKVFLDHVLAHEIAHAYTARIGKQGLPLSKETMNDIDQRQRACLYGDEITTKPIGEDLADLVAESIVERLNPKIDQEQTEGLFQSFCEMQKSSPLLEDGPLGHSFALKRFYNLVKYNKELQKNLNCFVPSNVCSIKIHSTSKK